MMALISILVCGAAFAALFRLLVGAHRPVAAKSRPAAHLMVAIGFLVLYLGYVLSYLPLQRELQSRFPAAFEFTTFVDDVAAVVPFAIAIAIGWMSSRARRSPEARALRAER